MNIINHLQFLLIFIWTFTEACRDYDGVVVQFHSEWGTSKFTCRHVLEEDSKEIVFQNETKTVRTNPSLATHAAPYIVNEKCERKMSWYVPKNATLGPGITGDMYIKDVCPFVFKDQCKTCATGSSTCSDHLGNIRRKGPTRSPLFSGADYVTCLDLAHNKDLNSDYCDKKVLDGFDSSEWTHGHRVTADMYIKDVCPVVFKDICTTCATGIDYCKGDRTLLASDTHCPKLRSVENATPQQAVNICFVSLLLLLALVI